jgi:hypothetical protein
LNVAVHQVKNCETALCSPDGVPLALKRIVPAPAQRSIGCCGIRDIYNSLSLRRSRGIGFGFDMTSLPDSTHGYSARILIQKCSLNLIRHHGGKGIASGTRNVFDVAILVDGLAVFISTHFDA